MYCSRCGATVADRSTYCSACGQALAKTPLSATVVSAVAPAEQVTAGERLYAGFWLRVVAAIVDGLILALPTAVIFFVLFASAMPALLRGGDPRILALLLLPRLVLLVAISLVGSWLYCGLMESSDWQATWGKKSLGLYVTDLAGNRATFGRTSGRFFAGRGIGMIPYLGGLYFIVSCIMAGFTEKKQALHDMIANCLVLRKA